MTERHATAQSLKQLCKDGNTHRTSTHRMGVEEASSIRPERGRKRNLQDAIGDNDASVIPLGLNPQGTGFLCTTVRRSTRQFNSSAHSAPTVQLGLNPTTSGYLYSKGAPTRRESTAGKLSTTSRKRSCIKEESSGAVREQIVQLGLHPLGNGYLVQKVTRSQSRLRVKFSEQQPIVGISFYSPLALFKPLKGPSCGKSFNSIDYVDASIDRSPHDLPYTCNRCQQYCLDEARYNCPKCEDFDLCESCFIQSKKNPRKRHKHALTGFIRVLD